MRSEISSCDTANFGMEPSAKQVMRILIADDQRGVGTSLAAMVGECNHEVVEVVCSGYDAIQAYQRHRPDLVLMDYYMPRLNGATACRNILAKDPRARVILVSGLSQSYQPSDSGAIAVLAKPIALDMLMSALEAARPQPDLFEEPSRCS